MMALQCHQFHGLRATHKSCLVPVTGLRRTYTTALQREQRRARQPCVARVASVNTTTEADARSTREAPSVTQQPDADTSNFNWLSNWYPVQVLESVDPSRPHAVELLGKQLVLWRDGAGQWRCMEDACPHRLAPLSEGRIEADGTLQCSYHGWRFDSGGRCTEIPQAIDDKAKAVACNSSRSCVTSYPVRQAAGLIWVWPTAGPAAEAEAAAAPVPLSKGCLAAWESGTGPSWYRRELPYSYDILIENLTDPSHLPFSHHNLTPNLKRSKGSSMPFSQIDIPQANTPEEQQSRPAFVFAHKSPIAAFEFPSAMAPSGRVCFTPPCSVNYNYDFAPTVSLQNDLIGIPAGPGKSVAYTIGLSTAAKVTPMDIMKALFTNPKQVPVLLIRYSFQQRPTYVSHLSMNKLFDQDSVFLNMQDRQLALRGKSSWVRDYYMPAPCDGLVIASRRWTQQALKLPVWDGKPAEDTFSLSAQAAAAVGPRPPQRAINNRYEQHTKHCTVCQKALEGLKRKLTVAQGLAVALSGALVGVLAGVVLPGLLALRSGAAAAGGGSAAVAAVAAAVLGIGALLSSAVAKATAKHIAEFEYVEFSHADNH